MNTKQNRWSTENGECDHYIKNVFAMFRFLSLVTIKHIIFSKFSERSVYHSIGSISTKNGHNTYDCATHDTITGYGFNILQYNTII